MSLRSNSLSTNYNPFSVCNYLEEAISVENTSGIFELGLTGWGKGESSLTDEGSQMVE